jgi:hypothetical protein
MQHWVQQLVVYILQLQKYGMTYAFGNEDLRIKKGYILFNAFLNLQISFIFH